MDCGIKILLLTYKALNDQALVAPLLWNKLPVNVREAGTLSTFKIRLKTFLFDNAYS